MQRQRKLPTRLLCCCRQRVSFSESSLTRPLASTTLCWCCPKQPAIAWWAAVLCNNRNHKLEHCCTSFSQLPGTANNGGAKAGMCVSDGRLQAMPLRCHMRM